MTQQFSPVDFEDGEIAAAGPDGRLRQALSFGSTALVTALATFVLLGLGAHLPDLF